MIVLLLFFCSGATALVYEVLWSKHLSLMLGSTVQAQTVVLAVFMGGLALGNRLFGRRADAAANPLAPLPSAVSPGLTHRAPTSIKSRPVFKDFVNLTGNNK